MTELEKNKVATPLYKTFIDIYFDKGIDHTIEIIDFALKKGAWYYFENEKIGQGRDATKNFLLNNVDLFDKIKRKAFDVVDDSKN